MRASFEEARHVTPTHDDANENPFQAQILENEGLQILRTVQASTLIRCRKVASGKRKLTDDSNQEFAVRYSPGIVPHIAI